jgi:hypothetical protein
MDTDVEHDLRDAKELSTYHALLGAQTWFKEADLGQRLEAIILDAYSEGFL